MGNVEEDERNDDTVRGVAKDFPALSWRLLSAGTVRPKRDVVRCKKGKDVRLYVHDTHTQ
jgi:hypothetical protein